MSKKLLLSFFSICIFLQSMAQCDGDRYRNFVFANHSLSSDLLYGANTDADGNDIDLFLDVYEPTGDVVTDRPLVIVVHGGSFIGGSKTGDDVVPICEDLAKMGYVVASIQYRLGVPIFGSIPQNAKKAVVRGMQDSKAAVRYFRRDVAESNNTFGINPEQIYMLGVSAGGFNALNVAYLDSDDEIPSDIDLSDASLSGGAEGDSGNPGYSSSIAGVVNVAGAIADLSLIEAGDAPVCSFHGTGDTVVPFGSDILTLLGIIEVDTVHGSESIHARADFLEIDNCFQIQFQEGHVPHQTNAFHYDTLRSVTSNFLSYLVCPDVELDCEYRALEVISSLDDLSTAQDARIYPNPANTQVTISRALGTQQDYLLMDLTGRVVQGGQLISESTTLDLSAVDTGMYLLAIETEASWQTVKLQVSH